MQEEAEQLFGPATVSGLLANDELKHSLTKITAGGILRVENVDSSLE
jgi:hypothetical protein